MIPLVTIKRVMPDGVDTWLRARRIGNNGVVVVVEMGSGNETAGYRSESDRDAYA